jgi:hypothetical protein
MRETTSMRRRWLPAMGLASGALAVLGAVQVVSGPASATEDPAPPARVAGVSYWLDAFETGARVTPGITNGLVSTVLSSQQLPPPLGQGQAEVLQAISDAAVNASVSGPAAIEQLRAALAPLACANPQINAGVAGFADGLDGLVTAIGPAIEPLDRTISQLSALIRASQETGPAPTC